MKKIFITASIVFTLGFGLQAQDIEVIKFNDLDRLITEKSDEYRIFNFWATWCKPCIAELPYFEEINRDFKDDVKVYLISMDFSEDLDTKVSGFVQKKNLQSIIKLLDETDYNSFIDRVSEQWSGAIPATLFVDSRNGNQKFHEGEFTREELRREVDQFIN